MLRFLRLSVTSTLHALLLHIAISCARISWEGEGRGCANEFLGKYIKRRERPGESAGSVSNVLEVFLFLSSRWCCIYQKIPDCCFPATDIIEIDDSIRKFLARLFPLVLLNLSFFSTPFSYVPSFSSESINLAIFIQSITRAKNLHDMNRKDKCYIWQHYPACSHINSMIARKRGFDLV